MNIRISVNFLSIVFGLFLLAGCSSLSPENKSTGGYENPQQNKDFAAIVLSDLKNSEENAAYTTGVTNTLDSKKVVPDVPDELRQTLSNPDVWVDHIDTVEEFLGKQFEFNAIVILQPTHTKKSTSILGIIPREQPLIKTEGLVYDLGTGEVTGQVTAYSPYNESAGVSSITNAAEEATSDLIHKNQNKKD